MLTFATCLLQYVTPHSPKYGALAGGPAKVSGEPVPVFDPDGKLCLGPKSKPVQVVD
jgi:hypothetical protein